MSLNMFGFIDQIFESKPIFGVTLKIPGKGGYTGPGGVWQEDPPIVFNLKSVNIQMAGKREAEFLMGQGGTVNISDFRLIHINDGIMIQPDDSGRFAQILEFHDGVDRRQWRVREADCRPWHNYCRLVVERYRGAN
mgnify:CR=1 FL=1